MKTVKFYKNGTTIRIFDYDDEQVVDKINPAVYTICQDMMGFYLSFVSDKFDVPNKIYGSTNSRVDKILKTYDERTRSTGVLMSGDKGSGKTMLSSLLCNKMIERGLPVILVEKPYTGTGFIDFLNNIGECSLFFDEFAKVFSKTDEYSEGEGGKSQDGLLSVFDGTHTIKRLILLTENEIHNINRYMLNRPGRIYYHFKYSKLEESLVREYCQSNDVPEDVVNAILFRIESSREFSFDALKAVVEEYIRFGENIYDIFKNLNIEEPYTFNKKMKVIKIVNTKTGEELLPSNEEVASPSDVGRVRINFIAKNNARKLDPDSEEFAIDSMLTKALKKEISYTNIDIKDLVERSDTRSVYENKGEGYIVVLEKIKEVTYQTYNKYLDSAYDD